MHYWEVIHIGARYCFLVTVLSFPVWGGFLCWPTFYDAHSSMSINNCILCVAVLPCVFLISFYFYRPQKASKLIVKRSSLMDGQLFLIKHLLILMEQVISLLSFMFPWLLFQQAILLKWLITIIVFQIAPFDIEFSVTHKELDFSHLLVSLRLELSLSWEHFYYFLFLPANKLHAWHSCGVHNFFSSFPFLHFK